MVEKLICLVDVFKDCDFLVILCLVDFYVGCDLEKIDDVDVLVVYLLCVVDVEFFLVEFIDYSDWVGLFWKFCVVLIDGWFFVCYMVVLVYWMVYYVNVGMYEDVEKCVEEVVFMVNFVSFVECYVYVLQVIYQWIGFDYLCIDCVEMLVGDLLVFEIGYVMVVYVMDSEMFFFYKQCYM